MLASSNLCFHHLIPSPCKVYHMLRDTQKFRLYLDCCLNNLSRHHTNLIITCISHGAEDALSDGHDSVCGLVVAADWLPPGCVLTDVLQEVFQSLTHHTSCCAHLQDRSSIISISSVRLKLRYTLISAVEAQGPMILMLLTHRLITKHQPDTWHSN